MPAIWTPSTAATPSPRPRPASRGRGDGRVNEYWSLRQNESANAADCCLNMAAGILQLSVGTDDKAAVLARLEDGLFAVVTVGTPAAP